MKIERTSSYRFTDFEGWGDIKAYIDKEQDCECLVIQQEGDAVYLPLANAAAVLCELYTAALTHEPAVDSVAVVDGSASSTTPVYTESSSVPVYSYPYFNTRGVGTGG